jgi:predicted RNA-binding protein Jag
MIKAVKQFLSDVSGILAELRIQNTQFQAREDRLTQAIADLTGKLGSVTESAQYLARIEADKRQRSGHPTI